jgi:hypothetical protein
MAWLGRPRRWPASISRKLVLAVSSLSVLAATVPCSADTIDLPPPQSDQLGGAELFQALGTSRDQLPGYLAPGALSNDEVVEVRVAADGGVSDVIDHQRIRITGSGDYTIREAGPVSAAAAAGGDAPVLNLGDVVWQGFSTGNRQLAADLKLDPEIEAGRLPLRITVTFTATAGRPAPVEPGGQLPGAGTVTVTLRNTTAQRTTLPSGRDAAAGPVAAALDRVLRTGAGRLPTSRTGLPAELPVTAATTRHAIESMPLQLRGKLGVSGQQSGAGRLSSIPLDAVLRSSSRFTLAVSRPGTLTLELTAIPVLDKTRLSPPRGFASWSAWAAAGPPVAERKAALDTLVQLAATGARASAYSPYLGSELPAAGRTEFHFTLTPQANPQLTEQPLKPRPVPIGLAILAGLLVIGAGTILWRRS